MISWPDPIPINDLDSVYIFVQSKEDSFFHARPFDCPYINRTHEEIFDNIGDYGPIIDDIEKCVSKKDAISQGLKRCEFCITDSI